MRGTIVAGLFLCVAVSLGCDGRSSQQAERTPATPDEAADARSEADPDVLARVDGMVVSTTDFQKAAQRWAAMHGGSISPDQRRDVLDGLVAEKLLYKAALEQGLDREPEVQQLMARIFYRKEINEKIPRAFPEEELQQYYETHLEEFAVPEGVRIRRILIKVTPERPDEAARARADAVHTELASGAESLEALTASFERLATEHSEDPNLPRGAASHFIRRNEPPWIDASVVEQAFELEVGKLSPVFRSAEGYNIVMVIDRRAHEQRPFEAVRPWVQRKVREERGKALYASHVAQLRSQASIEVDEARLTSVEVPPPRRGAPSPHGSAGAAPEQEGD